MRLQRMAAAFSVAALILAGTTACTSGPIVVLPSTSHSAGGTPLKVGTAATPSGGDSLESSLVSQVYVSALNAAGLNAQLVAEDAKNPTMLSSLQAGTVDIVPGYSSMFLQELLTSQKATASSAPSKDAVTSGEVLKALTAALPDGVAMTDPSSAEDNDDIVVTAVTAEKYQLKTVADLAKVCDKLAFGGSADFKIKDRGLVTLATDYNCIPKKYVELPSAKSELLLALLSDNVQVADLASSSPAIEANSLVVLEDNKQIFRPQTIVPLVSDSSVSADVRGVLNKVSAALNDDELANLNLLSTSSHYGSEADVAKAWLVQQGLIKATS